VSANTLHDKLEQITTLARGKHDEGEAMCAMEAVAWLAGEPWSDAPHCVSLVIAAFMRSWNDALPDADRARLLLPLLPDVIGTRTTDADDETRAWMATDWLVRVNAPAWLDLTPSLEAHAAALRALPPIMSSAVARDSQSVITAARVAAGDAARAAVSVAAWDAVSVAARDAAWDAAWAAVSVSAARDALAPTITTLQASAQELVRRMCAVGLEASNDAR
jgi:hypothetical protein